MHCIETEIDHLQMVEDSTTWNWSRSPSDSALHRNAAEPPIHTHWNPWKHLPKASYQLRWSAGFNINTREQWASTMDHNVTWYKRTIQPQGGSIWMELLSPLKRRTCLAVSRVSSQLIVAAFMLHLIFIPINWPEWSPLSPVIRCSKVCRPKSQDLTTVLAPRNFCTTSLVNRVPKFRELLCLLVSKKTPNNAMMP